MTYEEELWRPSKNERGYFSPVKCVFHQIEKPRKGHPVKLVQYLSEHGSIEIFYDGTDHIYDKEPIKDVQDTWWFKSYSACFKYCARLNRENWKLTFDRSHDIIQ
jgi:hypothetical protein